MFCLGVHLRGQRLELRRNFNRIGGAGFEPPQRLRQSCQLVRSTFANLRERRRRSDTFAATHHRNDQGFAILLVALER